MYTLSLPTAVATVTRSSEEKLSVLTLTSGIRVNKSTLVQRGIRVNAQAGIRVNRDGIRVNRDGIRVNRAAADRAGIRVNREGIRVNRDGIRVNRDGIRVNHAA
ncbi:hypothetical protein [Kutzneria sp. CA-103260]|uniref:hypothetical protein n=1 Tax=Kutzneria sp. CA-103260 TaxID=2802641 RepID=UPI001BA4D0B4|nr:hypothetical protein [Kutzneria sp. CA-103260]QUQ68132.1 hypothetical protein JJ691_58740 [Kutzneria sp. CA-103260]